MIREYFGLAKNPFEIDSKAPLLAHQQRHFDILKVHSQQGGLCVLIGEPGTGKTILKNAIMRHDTNRWITPVINRSLHTWPNIVKLFCNALDLDSDGTPHRCEERLITEARSLNSKGKILIPIVDDAHLLPAEVLRKFRLLLEDFPKNHNLILIGQPELNTTLQLKINNDLKTRITYSAKLDALSPADLKDYIHSQLDRVGLPYATFTEAAVNLILRSAEGTLRATKNLAVSGMIEAVSDQTKTIDTKQINAVLMQPHWRHNQQLEPIQPIAMTNKEKHQLQTQS